MSARLSGAREAEQKNVWRQGAKRWSSNYEDQKSTKVRAYNNPKLVPVSHNSKLGTFMGAGKKPHLK